MHEEQTFNFDDIGAIVDELNENYFRQQTGRTTKRATKKTTTTKKKTKADVDTETALTSDDESNDDDRFKLRVNLDHLRVWLQKADDELPKVCSFLFLF